MGFAGPGVLCMWRLPHPGYAFLERYRDRDRSVPWLKPAVKFTGDHIFIDNGELTFDYNGYSDRGRRLTRTFGRARGW
jgi:hypothetical protein